MKYNLRALTQPQSLERMSGFPFLYLTIRMLLVLTRWSFISRIRGGNVHSKLFIELT
jgi:hypothetical protein